MHRTQFFSALTIAVAGILPACSSGPTPAGPTTAPGLAGDARHASWIDTKNPPTVFVGSNEGYSVEGYDQKTGEVTETLSLAQPPQGIAVDKNENLYVALLGSGINVYPPGSTTPSLTLTYPGQHPYGVAVSAKGEVAVTERGYASVTVYFYKQGATTSFNSVTSSTITAAGFDCYDAKGNLYFVATAASGSPVVAVVAGGGKGSAVTVTGITNVEIAGGIQVDRKNELLVQDTKALAIYRYPLPNPAQPSGSTPTGGDLRGPIDFALTSSEKTFWLTDFYNREIAEYRFPKGGWPKKWFRSYGFYNTPYAVAAAPAAKL